MGVSGRLERQSLGHRADQLKAAAFQGRHVEFAAVLGFLRDDGLLPAVASVHGPPGIGKTWFAHALVRACEEAKLGQAAVIDSRDFSHSRGGLEHAVAARFGAWPVRGDDRLLLVIDTFEEMGDMERVFIEEFLRPLRAPVLVLLAGRHPVTLRTAAAGWRDLIIELELPGLTAAESRQLLRHMGLADEDGIAAIARTAGGNPLLLTLAAELAQHRDTNGFAAADLATTDLVRRFTREINDLEVRQLLEAASLVRTFNEELLASMVRFSAPTSFARLCDLSFVRRSSHGARVHDVLREVVAADLRWREPLRVETMRERAYRHLKQMLRHAPDPGPWAQELLYLAAGSAAQARFYAASRHPDVEIRPARQDDLPVLVALCRQGVTRFGLPVPVRVSQVVADFAVAPEWFLLAADPEAGIVGFAYALPLTQESWPMVAGSRRGYADALPADEIAAIRCAPPAAPAAFLVAGATHLSGYDHVAAPLREALFGKRTRCAPNARRSYHLLAPDSPDAPYIEQAGLQRRLVGITLDDCPVSLDEWLFDLGVSGFVGWLDQVLGGSIEPSAYSDGMSEPALIELVKSALASLHCHPALRESPLTTLYQVASSPGDTALALRAVLTRAVGELESAKARRDKEAGVLLRDYYLRQVGSHEAVSEGLGLSRTTYYRRLHHGLAFVARRVRSEECQLVAGRTVVGPPE